MHWWRLDFGIKLINDGDWKRINEIGEELENQFGGEELGAGTGFGVRNISLLFPTEEKAKQAKLALRRLSRGKPRFEIEYADAAPYEEYE